jgi:Zn-dependent protease
MLYNNPASFISGVLILIIAFPIHEFAHAWTANLFGDSTPRINGRLTLNPLAHLDPIGSLALLFIGIGWAKPVPVNPYTLRQHSRSAMMWVALAGPLSNFLLAVLAAIPFQLNWFTLDDLINAYATTQSAILPTPVMFTYYFIEINLLLGLFNLIPIPPLDGDKIAEFFMPDDWKRTMDKIRPYGGLILMALFLVGPSLGLDFLGWMIRKPLGFLTNLLIR